jgi:hypothetical protein
MTPEATRLMVASDDRGALPSSVGSGEPRFTRRLDRRGGRMRRRVVVLLAGLGIVVGTLTATAPAAAAREIRIIGCDSLLNWPCPGPMPVAP